MAKTAIMCDYHSINGVVTDLTEKTQVFLNGLLPHGHAVLGLFLFRFGRFGRFGVSFLFRLRRLLKRGRKKNTT